jgi:hypothetical protein
MGCLQRSWQQNNVLGRVGDPSFRIEHIRGRPIFFVELVRILIGLFLGLGKGCALGRCDCRACDNGFELREHLVGSIHGAWVAVGHSLDVVVGELDLELVVFFLLLFLMNRVAWANLLARRIVSSLLSAVRWSTFLLYCFAATVARMGG